jgi:hypothetical protein
VDLRLSHPHAHRKAPLHQKPFGSRAISGNDSEDVRNFQKTRRPVKVYSLSDRKVERLHGLLAETSPEDISEIMFLRWQLCNALSEAGDSVGAVAEYEAFEKLTRPEHPEWFKLNEDELDLFIAVNHLRRAELDNCVANHTAESCIFPIQGGGVHQLRDGAEKAFDRLLLILKRDPERMRARWLLQIAAMALGEFPDKIPEAFRLPVDHFDYKGSFPRYKDRAMDLGINYLGGAGASIVEDFDRDGDLDIFTSSWTPGDPCAYYVNTGSGFEDAAEKAGLGEFTGGLNAMHADYNNDGFADIFVVRGAWHGPFDARPNSLLRNNGDGTFSDVTASAGVLEYAPTQAVAWFDYNNDGFLDLFVGNEKGPDNEFPCSLFHNNGDETFTEISSHTGLTLRAYVKSVTAGDFNNDGRPDLFVSVFGGPNHLFRNDGPAPESEWGAGAFWKFTDVAAEAGVRDHGFSFTSWFWDFDNDGHEDLYVAGYNVENVGDFARELLGQPNEAVPPKLYRNKGDGTFEDATAAAGLDRIILTMGGNFGDLDNDGFLDFYIGTGDPAFATLRRQRGGRFRPPPERPRHLARRSRSRRH